MRPKLRHALLLAAVVAPAHAAELTFATWNIRNLATEGRVFYDGCCGRSAADLDRLKAVADELKADVIAVQEASSLAALARVFSPERYALCLGSRTAEPACRDGDGPLPDVPPSETPAQNLAFAIRRGAGLGVVSVRNVDALSVAPDGGWPEHPGLELTLEMGGKRLALLNVHLAGCYDGQVDPTSPNPACRAMAAQAGPLRAWLRDRSGEASAVLGDFNRRFDRETGAGDLWSVFALQGRTACLSCRNSAGPTIRTRITASPWTGSSRVQVSRPFQRRAAGVRSAPSRNSRRSRSSRRAGGPCRTIVPSRPGSASDQSPYAIDASTERRTPIGAGAISTRPSGFREQPWEVPVVVAPRPIHRGGPPLSNAIVQTPLQYLDKATSALRDMGLLPEKTEDAPINALLHKISDLDEERITVIARTLAQASVFNDVVRRQTEAVEIGQRYQEIARSFDSIRDDAKGMVDQLDDGRVDFMERVQNAWMKISRGDVADRFDRIRSTYLDVARSTHEQIERESIILDAYRDFRGALKQAEVLALEVLEKATARLETEKAALGKAADAVSAFTGPEAAARARLELARDEQLRRTQDEEKRYQIAKDLSDNLTVSYNTSEVIMARLLQTTNAKERIYAQAVSFFSTNDSVLTALKASFTGLFGLHEATQTLDTMKEGVSKSLEVLAEIGNQVGEAAVRSGYGPTIRADAVKKLVDSVISFQERSLEIVAEMRELSTRNSAEIRDAVEDGKRRIARLVADGKALPLNG